jgi:hypothetical protein
LIHFVGIPPALGTENAWNSDWSHSAEDKNVQNSVRNHFVEEKNTRNFVISFLTIPWKIKMLGIPFCAITQKRKTHRILFWTIRPKKNSLESRSEPFKDKEKHMDFIIFGKSAKLYNRFWKCIRRICEKYLSAYGEYA